MTPAITQVSAALISKNDFVMARVFNNVLTSGVRGRIGNQLVFRVVNGVTIVSHAPAKPDRRKETEAQRKTRTTFRVATQWAKSQLVNPERRDYYTRLARSWNLTNAYTAAIKDYMCKVKSIQESGGVAMVSDRYHEAKFRDTPNKQFAVAAPAFSFFDTPKPATLNSSVRLSGGVLVDYPTSSVSSLDVLNLPLNRGTPDVVENSLAKFF